MATDDTPVRFVVATPQPLLDQLRRWAEQVAAVGRSAEYVEVLKTINERLESNPHGWGDLLRDYATIDAVERRGLIPKWLLVWYGVHDAARQVVVHQLLPAPGSPLGHPDAAG